MPSDLLNREELFELVRIEVEKGVDPQTQIQRIEALGVEYIGLMELSREASRMALQQWREDVQEQGLTGEARSRSLVEWVITLYSTAFELGMRTARRLENGE